MKSFKGLFEASYSGNLGFEEMIKFYKKASDKDVKELNKIIDDKDWEGYKRIIQKVLGVRLK